MEEFPDNPRIAEIIQRYQIKKNNIENNYKPKARLYSSHNINLFTNGNNATPWNRQLSQSNDKRRIFIYANDRNDNKNEKIKKEERRINNTNPNKNNKSSNNNNSIKEKYPDLEEEEIDDEFDDNEEIIYEHEIVEKVKKFKEKIYKNFLKKLKIEKK